jgi:hypothetical protein
MVAEFTPSPSEGADAEWRARRSVVEARHSWLNRNRAIPIRWSKRDGKTAIYSPE